MIRSDNMFLWNNILITVGLTAMLTGLGVLFNTGSLNKYDKKYSKKINLYFFGSLAIMSIGAIIMAIGAKI